MNRVSSLGPGLARVELEGNALGEGVAPGRFAMVEAPGRADCALLRPYSYASQLGRDRIALLVKDFGRGSRALIEAPAGSPVAVLGPLGNAFPAASGSAWAVAGGVGAAPFAAFAPEAAPRVIFGARSEKEAGFARALEESGLRVDLATDDGSAGFAGTAVDCLLALFERERPDILYSCGPTAMMRAVAQVAFRYEIPCWVSLEARMGCGFGVCRSCAHPDAGGGWRCICEDGPVFPAETIFAREEGAA